jgi:hypothetical protein
MTLLGTALGGLRIGRQGPYGRGGIAPFLPLALMGQMLAKRRQQEDTGALIQQLPGVLGSRQTSLGGPQIDPSTLQLPPVIPGPAGELTSAAGSQDQQQPSVMTGPLSYASMQAQPPSDCSNSPNKARH